MIVAAYTVYLALSLAVTVWVGRTLHKNGRVFLIDALHGNAELAGSVNHLLVVGFYLINFGYVACMLKAATDLQTARAAIELVSGKIGGVLLILGVMHFFNLFLLNKVRRRGQQSIRAQRESLLEAL